MAILKVRTTPIDVFYLTGIDAEEAREAAGEAGSAPCFTTAMMGDDGFTWDTCEQFEADYAATFGSDKLPKVPAFSAAPAMLTALEGLLAQLEGPAMVYGNGIGNDGTKSGLSHEEFNALLDSRIAQARDAIAKAKPITPPAATLPSE